MSTEFGSILQQALKIKVTILIRLRGVFKMEKMLN